MIRLNEAQPPPESQPVSSASIQPPRRLGGRRFYFLLGLIAVVALVSAFTLAYLLPKGEAASVAVGLDYSVGEKMTYEYSMSVKAMGQTVTQTGTMMMEVIDFDGENYTLRETTNVQGMEYSFTVKMNKTGYILEYEDLPAQFEQTYGSLTGMPGFGLYFQKDQMKVGDNFQIPIQVQTDQFSFTGLAFYRIGEVKDITVPAGTYNAFRLETSALLIGDFGSLGTTTMTVQGGMSGYGYLEAGTCRQIEYHVSMQITVSAMSTSVSMSMTMSLQLTEDIRP